MAFSRLIRAAADGLPFPLNGDRDAARSFTYVSDAVEATVLAMVRAPAGAVINVGGPSSITLGEAIATLERICSRPIEVAAAEGARGDARRTAADTSRARALLGWEPTVALEEGLRAQWRWARERVGRSGWRHSPRSPSDGVRV